MVSRSSIHSNPEVVKFLCKHHHLGLKIRHSQFQWIIIMNRRFLGPLCYVHNPIFRSISESLAPHGPMAPPLKNMKITATPRLTRLHQQLGLCQHAPRTLRPCEPYHGAACHLGERRRQRGARAGRGEEHWLFKLLEVGGKCGKIWDRIVRF